MACLTPYILSSALFVAAAALPASVPTSNTTLAMNISSGAGNSSIAGATSLAYGGPSSRVTAGWVPISIYLLFIFDVLSIVTLVAISLNPLATEELAFRLMDCATWSLRYIIRMVSSHHSCDPSDRCRAESRVSLTDIASWPTSSTSTSAPTSIS